MSITYGENKDYYTSITPLEWLISHSINLYIFKRKVLQNLVFIKSIMRIRKRIAKDDNMTDLLVIGVISDCLLQCYLY